MPEGCSASVGQTLVLGEEEWDAYNYNEFNQYEEFMENPVAPWFENGDDDNGGPGAFTHFIG